MTDFNRSRPPIRRLSGLFLAGLALAACAGGGSSGNGGKTDADPGGEGNVDAAPQDGGGEGGTGGNIIPAGDVGTGGGQGGQGGEGGQGGSEGGQGGQGGQGGAGGTPTPVCEDGAEQPCPDETCKGGIQACRGGQWTACIGPAEMCDGLDNDCDGVVDNGFDGLGEACLAGQGLCETMGVVVCAASGADVQCNATPGAPEAVELCDGLDNDCDGETDEGADGTPLTETCYDGEAGQRGVGACVEGVSTCTDGAFGGCVGAGRPGDEICNGIDDDCDGAVDQSPAGGPLTELCYTGPAGTANQGVCRAGESACVDGVAGPCVGETVPAEEICDGADNDCDGVVDQDAAGGCGCVPGTTRDCYAGPEGTEGVGACRAGRQTCAADGAGYGACEGMVLPAAEQCDGRDNDCNGITDDGIPGAGDGCTAGVGACAREGVRFCNPATALLECGARPGQPAAETCNGLDDDCNGDVDDGTGRGDPCVDGVGACRVAGVLVCGPAGGVVCETPVVAPVDELCDGLDNDCNGAVDDGLRLGEACSVGLGVCASEGRLTCAADGTVTCDAVPREAGREICDGLDNNCDGAVDEGNPGGGAPCDTGLRGVCAAGTLACAEGGLRCVQSVQASAERCDGLDNDCSGVADDTPDGFVLSVSCYDGPAGTEGVGACLAGEQTCNGGALGACDGQVLPAVEVCDSVDNDCNGEVDDLPGGASCACEPGSVQQCYSGPEGTAGIGACAAGLQRCADDGLSFGPCEDEVLPRAELCDGSDNDCDGELDEDVPGAGNRCTVGVGACRAAGVTVCDGEQGELVCNAIPGAPTDEICDGLDNDCDGSVDDGIGLGERCVVGIGDCQNTGVRVCGGDGTVVCSAQPGRPRAEICDDRDNDCDGQVDDGLGLGDRCEVGVGECRRTGANVCGVNGNVVCGAVAGEPQAEACDGLDNDCDGQVDDGNPGGGQACDTGNPGVCARGVRMCEVGRFVCQQTGQPGAEVCDGLDNDCNGRTDEAANGGFLTQACYSGAPGTQGVGPCRGGAQTCDNGRYGACVGEVVPAAEICDGQDNNCDGRADNLPGGAMCACQPGQQRQCYTGPAGTAGVGICRAGTQACLADGSNWGPCGGEVLPAAEVCNGRDDNCNAAVDDAAGVGTGCSEGVGACLANGQLVCDAAAGRLICNAVPGRPRPETCDRVDNDCNGAVDDVAGLGDACVSGVGECSRPGNQICDLAQGILVCDALAGAPGREVCDGLDNDCDAQTDDAPMPGIGDRCIGGIGECAAAGVTVCDGEAGARCDAPVGEPEIELCDGLDNDCDGAVDDAPADVGQDCSVGVGACARDGVTLCNAGGELVCDAVAGQPIAELCNGIDDDCDGAVDDGRDCRVYRSCLDAYTRGAVANGVYRLSPDGAAAVDVYCDQTTDFGGWTLVGSTVDTPLNDQGQNYYADLSTLAPAGAHLGIWNGLRSLGERFDVRFACRDAVGAADAPMTVDLSFYRTPWYREWTTGADADSCFSEGNGAGEDLPQPARRNNLSGAFASRGTSWAAGYLEGEDTCGDTGDFSVDFADRGMDSNESDGTDWGEDDNSKKCGQRGLATGQWFVFARERQRTAVVGPATLTPALQAAGIPAETIAFDANLASRMTAENYETIFLGRYAAFWPLVTVAAQNALRAYGDAGGNIVTEFDGLSIFGTGFEANYRYAAGAPRPFGWINGTIGGGQVIQQDYPVTQMVPTDGVFAGVPNPFRGGAGTESFFYLQPPANGGNTWVRRLGVFAGGNAGFPGGLLQTVVRGRHCGGNLIGAQFDFADNVADPELATFIGNLGREALRPPPADLQDSCRPRLRPNVMVCGSSERDLSSLLNRGGTTFVRVDACVPDANTQALLVTRDGAVDLDPVALRAYLDAGGIVITEYSVGDEVFNAAFGDQGVPAVVQSAERYGNCADAIMPLVQYGPGQTLWDENRFVAPSVNNGGCGYDLSAFPGITPLGGPQAGVVTLAYRDRGQGRVWLVESDWQDGDLGDFEPSAGLMHHMILYPRERRLSFAGVRLAVPEAELLDGGFRRCWSGPYNGNAPLNDVRAACDQNVLLMGCRQVGQTSLTLAAMGLRTDLLTDVGDGVNASVQHNGATWYYSPSRSWGFAPANVAVNRSTCDTTADATSAQRMCIHTTADAITAGWRCGATTNLNASAQWERVLFERADGL
jgi:Notch-like protein